MDQNSPEPGQEAREIPAAAPAKVIDRRTLLRAGAASTPVLLTLASGPVAAGTTGCMVASSFVSVATFKSRNPGSNVGCTTQNCEYWQSKAKVNYWPGVGCNTPALNAKVSTALGSPSGCTYNNWLICDVLQTISSSGDIAVLQRMLSLYLDLTVTPINILAGNGISPAYLQTMWLTYYPSKKYTATAGVIWYEADMLKWLNAMLGYSF